MIDLPIRRSGDLSGEFVIYLAILRRAAGTVGFVLLSVVLVAGRQDARAGLCGSLDRPLADQARMLEPLGEPARTALVSLAESPVEGEALCGIAGLSALGDRRVIPLLASALRNEAFREEAYRLARWAAFVAGGPDRDLGEAMLPVVDALGDGSIRDAVGDDAIWLLGEVDHAAARDRLLAELDRTRSEATLDAVVHALARQGDPRVRARVAALGADALRGKSGNATPEQARRLGAVAFYQLALAPESMTEGFETLGTIALRDQEAAAAWAVHTLCARAVRRPGEQAAIEAHRLALVDDLGRRGVSWSGVKGPFGCGR